VSATAEKEKKETTKLPPWKWHETGKAEKGLTGFYRLGRVGLIKSELRDDVEKDGVYALVQFPAEGEPTADRGEVLETIPSYSDAREAAEERVRETPDLVELLAAPKAQKRARPKGQPRVTDGKTHPVKTRVDESIKRKEPPKGSHRRGQKGAKARRAQRVA
jgi:hypothetical protein